MNTIDMSTAAGAASPVQRARLRHHPLLGGLLVKEGLINETQLERALALQHEVEPRPLLGQVLLDQKLITPHELNAVLSKYQRKHLLGDVLIETKAVTPAQLDAALAAQRKTDRALGDALIQLGFITERQLKQALAIQLRIPFVNLDEHALEPSLRSVLSESYARHHRVLPIAKDDDRIVLAMDDPTDLEIIAEVRSCTGQRIDVVTATAEAMEHAFSRLYGVPGDARPSVGPSAGVETEEPAAAVTEHTILPPAASKVAASLPEGASIPLLGRSAIKPGRSLRSTRSAPAWIPSGSLLEAGNARSTRSRLSFTIGGMGGPRSSVCPASFGRDRRPLPERPRRSTPRLRPWPGSRRPMPPRFGMERLCGALWPTSRSGTTRSSGTVRSPSTT